VDQHHSVNKMTSYNLSLLFGPTLLRAPNSLQDLDDMQPQAKIIELMIVNYNSIFPEEIEEV